VVNLFLKTIGPPPGSILDLRSRAPDDPVFAAIERHRQAMRTRPAEHDDDARDRLLAAEGDAFVEWLTTPPTTMAGVIATLDHAAANYSDGFDSYYCRGDGDLSDVVAAGEQFPAMIAAALRQIVADKSP
jgi:hypothetical protein